MSKIEVNEISKTSTGTEITISSPVSMDSPLKVKVYTTSQINGLTPSQGQIVFDSDEAKLKVYDGSAWQLVGGADFSAVGENIIPSADITYDLGSNSYRWRDLYLSGSSIHLGDQTITANSTSISLSGTLKLKQQTTSQINALTGVTEGEMVYDTGTSQIKVHNGTEFLAVQASTGITASGGDVIETYSAGGVDYKSHTFTSSGTFQVTSASAGSIVDILLVAGGGAGGTDNAGGGGAGGMLVQAGVAASAQNYSIVIGNGGTKGSSSDGNGTASTAGDDTTAFGYTAIGGGQGGSAGTANNAGGGGSGGGRQGAEISGTVGSGTTGQGNDGGAGSGGGGGGGGGAGAAGQTVTGTVGGTGGVGLTNDYADGTSTYYAGGGAGGNENGVNNNVAGGNGGGATSPGNDGTPSAGTANTGGGGAGGTHSGNSGSSGGSGVVVIRYAV